MKKLVMTILMGILLVVGMGLSPVFATTINISLNNFTLEGKGSIAPDGSWASLLQEPIDGSTKLLNDPLWGVEVGISLPAGALTLSFDYGFYEKSGNETDFYVQLFDGVNGDLISDLLLSDTSSGHHDFDLTTLLLPGQDLLGLNFYLNETQYSPEVGGYFVGSSALIKNLNLTVSDQVPVPEPASLLLLGMGMIILGGIFRKRLS